MIKLTNRLGASIDLTYAAVTRLPLNFNVPITSLADGDGGVVSGLTKVEPRIFTVAGPVYNPTKAVIKDTLNTLMTILQYPPIQVYDGDRFIFARAQGNQQEWLSGKRELRLNIPFIAPDPYFYGDLKEIENPSVIENEGTVPLSPLIVVSLTAGGSSFKITNTTTSQEIEITTTLANGDEVVIDNKNFTVELNGDRILDKVTEQWTLDGFQLTPGNNNISYAGVSANRTFVFRDKYL